MKTVLTLLLFMFVCGLHAQSLSSISGKINSANKLTFSAATAGINPSNLSSFNTNNSTSNTSQSFSYSWSFLGSEGDTTTYVIGSIGVITNNATPSGLKWTIKASSPSSSRYGTSSGVKTLGTTKQTLISGIWSTNLVIFWGYALSISNTLTQILSVSDFSAIRPGTTSMTLTYELQ
jgi:hypothetical protein